MPSLYGIDMKVIQGFILVCYACTGHQKSNPTLKELFRYRDKISDRWKIVALELDLPREKVETIDTNNPRVQDKCYEMFSTWLRRSVDPKPCWCQIAFAFHMAELEALSKQIREQYLSKYTMKESSYYVT